MITIIVLLVICRRLHIFSCGFTLKILISMPGEWWVYILIRRIFFSSLSGDSVGAVGIPKWSHYRMTWRHNCTVTKKMIVECISVWNVWSLLWSLSKQQVVAMRYVDDLFIISVLHDHNYLLILFVDHMHKQ